MQHQGKNKSKSTPTSVSADRAEVCPWSSTFLTTFKALHALDEHTQEPICSNTLVSTLQQIYVIEAKSNKIREMMRWSVDDLEKLITYFKHR